MKKKISGILMLLGLVFSMSVIAHATVYATRATLVPTCPAILLEEVTAQLRNSGAETICPIDEIFIQRLNEAIISGELVYTYTFTDNSRACMADYITHATLVRTCPAILLEEVTAQLRNSGTGWICPIDEIFMQRLNEAIINGEFVYTYTFTNNSHTGCADTPYLDSRAFWRNHYIETSVSVFPTEVFWHVTNWTANSVFLTDFASITELANPFNIRTGRWSNQQIHSHDRLTFWVDNLSLWTVSELRVSENWVRQPARHVRFPG